MTPTVKTFVSAAAISVLTMAPGVGMTTDINLTTSNALQSYGYDISAMELTTGQVAEAVAILDSDENEATKRARLDVLFGTTAPASAGPSLEGNVEQGQIVAGELREYGYDVAPKSLGTSDIAELRAVIGSDQTTRSKMAEIDRILSEGEISFLALDGNTMLRQTVGSELQALGLAVDVETLTDAQLAELKLLLSSDLSQNEKQRRAEAIFAS